MSSKDRFTTGNGRESWIEKLVREIVEGRRKKVEDTLDSSEPASEKANAPKPKEGLASRLRNKVNDLLGRKGKTEEEPFSTPSAKEAKPEDHSAGDTGEETDDSAADENQNEEGTKPEPDKKREGDEPPKKNGGDNPKTEKLEEDSKDEDAKKTVKNDSEKKTSSSSGEEPEADEEEPSASEENSDSTTEEKNQTDASKDSNSKNPPKSPEALTEDFKELLEDPDAYPTGHPAHNALRHQIANAELSREEQNSLRNHLEHPLEGPTPQMEELFNRYPTPEALKGAKDEAEAEIGRADKAIEEAKEQKQEKMDELKDKKEEITRLEKDIADARKNLEANETAKLKAKNDFEREGFEKKVLELNKTIEAKNKKLKKATEEEKNLKTEIKNLEKKAKEEATNKSNATLKKDNLEKAITYKNKDVHRYSSMGDLMFQIEGWFRRRAGENPSEQAVLNSVNEQMGLAHEEAARADSHDLFKDRITPLGSLKATLEGFKNDPYLAHLDMEPLAEAHNSKPKVEHYFEALEEPPEEEKKMKLVSRLSKLLEQAIGSAQSRGKRPSVIEPMKNLKKNLDLVLKDYIHGQTEDKKERLKLGEKFKTKNEDLQMEKSASTPKGRAWETTKSVTKKIAGGAWKGVKGIGKGIGWAAKKGVEWLKKDKKNILLHGAGLGVGIAGGFTVLGIIALTAASPFIYRKAQENPGKLKILAKSWFLTPLVTYWDLPRKEGREKFKRWWNEKSDQAPISTPPASNGGDYEQKEVKETKKEGGGFMERFKRQKKVKSEEKGEKVETETQKTVTKKRGEEIEKKNDKKDEKKSGENSKEGEENGENKKVA